MTEIILEKSDLEKIASAMFDGEIAELGTIPANAMFRRVEITEKGDLKISYVSEEEAMAPCMVSLGVADE